MKTCFIVTITDKKIEPTIASILNNTIEPDYILYVAKEPLSDSQLKIMNASISSCCGNSITKNESESCIVTLSDKIGLLESRSLSYQDLNHKIFEILKSLNVKVFFTSKLGQIFDNKYIEKCLNILADNAYGAVYTDYIKDGKLEMLKSINILLNTPIPVEEFCMRLSCFDSNTNIYSGFETLSNVYKTRVISHITENLYTL